MTLPYIDFELSNRLFVSARGTDICVICGADTGIPTDTPIWLRDGYVEGSGQCCAVCSEDD